MIEFSKFVNKKIYLIIKIIKNKSI